ncbi:MAG TPA: LAGLIDADG family homing endonuclease, partial [Solirubrobacteraceae bacterium]
MPGGRILAGAGSGHAVTFFNCFHRDTPVHVREGVVPIGSLCGEHEVLSQGGVYRRARFRSFGRQRLLEVELDNGATLRATAGHQWVVTKRKGGAERVSTTSLLGRRIPVNPRPAPARDADFEQGVRHGLVFGDGSISRGKSYLRLFGESRLLVDRFGAYRVHDLPGSDRTPPYTHVHGLPVEWKRLPADDASASYWRGFVAGWLAADGHVDKRGVVSAHNKDRSVLERVAAQAAKAGLVATRIVRVRQLSPY